MVSTTANMHTAGEGPCVECGDLVRALRSILYPANPGRMVWVRPCLLGPQLMVFRSATATRADSTAASMQWEL